MATGTEEKTTFQADAPEASAGPRAFCVVYQDGRSSSTDIPVGEIIQIGRSRSCSIYLADTKASRVHATLRWDGSALALQDLGSTNGTRINGRRVSGTTELHSGDEVTVGSARIVVGLTAPPLSLGRRVLAHADFEDRLSQEVARASEYRRTLALLMAAQPCPAELKTLHNAVRDIDVVGAYGPSDFEILAPEVDSSGALSIAERLTAADTSVRVGFAMYPADASDEQHLLGAARKALSTTDSASRLARATAETDGADSPVAAAPQTRQVWGLIERVADRRITVLITGETGVGKEVVAREIHRRGRGEGRPFVALNCAALPAGLVESELFGHEKGAFTGATSRKQGLFEVADGGTLFLDEIGELSAATQAMLLRVLERREIQRVGGTRSIPVDVRLIAATHRDLEREVHRGTFREDLLFRLNAFVLHVPPLRERLQDVAPLSERFLRELAAASGMRPAVLSAGALLLLERYPWPGNVRELRNVLERAVVLAESDVLDERHFPERMRRDADVGAAKASLHSSVGILERDAIAQALRACAGNQTLAARQLGISRRALIYKMEKHGLKPRPQ